MNRAAVSAFERVAECARRGRRKDLARTLKMALFFWDMPKRRLPRWFREGAHVIYEGQVFKVVWLRHDRFIMEHRYTLERRIDAKRTLTISGFITGYEPVFPVKRALRAAS